MAGHGLKKNRLWDSAIEALLAESTITAAASKVGVSERTLRRWLEDPNFRSEYLRSRRGAVDYAVCQLQSMALSAALTMGSAVGVGGDPTRLRAAEAVYDRAVKGIETMDHEERLGRVEEAVAALAERVVDLLAKKKGAKP